MFKVLSIITLSILLGTVLGNNKIQAMNGIYDQFQQLIWGSEYDSGQEPADPWAQWVDHASKNSIDTQDQEGDTDTLKSEQGWMQCSTNAIKDCMHSCLDMTKQAALLAFFNSSIPAMHELGHFFAAKLLDPTSNPTVHLFSGIGYGLGPSTPLVDFGSIKIYTDILTTGATIMQPILDPTKNMVMLAAGPIAGLLNIYIFFAAQAAVQKYKETKNIKESLSFGLKYALSPYQNLLERKGLGILQFMIRLYRLNKMADSTITQLAYLLTPLTPGGDGQKIWRILLGYNDNVCYLGRLKTVCLDRCSQLNYDILDCINEGYTSSLSIDSNRVSEVENLIKNGAYDCDIQAWAQGMFSTDQTMAAISKDCIQIAHLAIFYKLQACFSSFIFNEPSIVHVMWNKALRPIGAKFTSGFR